VARTAEGWLGEVAGVAPGRDVLHAGRVVLGVAVALTALGLVLAYSSSSAMLALRGKEPNLVLVKQLTWTLLAAAGAWILAHVPLSALSRFARPALLLVLGLLVATAVFGVTVNGSRRWLEVLGQRIQPSELLKLAVLLYLADALSKREENAHFGRQPPLLGMVAPLLLGVGLVLIQPDLGTSLFLVAESVVLLGLAGVRPTRLAPAMALMLPAILVLAWSKFPHVQRRWSLWTGGAPTGRTQVEESLVAIGSGGLFGMGLGQGQQKLGYLAESHTDFIGAVLGEELGFVGCAAVILGFMAIVWYGRKVTLAARALSPQAAFLAGGATFVIAFQAAINLAVVTNSAPTKGIPLPFISVGGSNLVLMLACVGLIVNVARRSAAALGDSPDYGAA
jgi:cell division protein FtsW